MWSLHQLTIQTRYIIWSPWSQENIIIKALWHHKLLHFYVHNVMPHLYWNGFSFYSVIVYRHAIKYAGHMSLLAVISFVQLYGKAGLVTCHLCITITCFNMIASVCARACVYSTCWSYTIRGDIAPTVYLTTELLLSLYRGVL